MPDQDIAERIRETIKIRGGYERISEQTGINVRTLTRIATGKTEPKLKDVIAISQVTGRSIHYFVYREAGKSAEDIAIEDMARGFASLMKSYKILDDAHFSIKQNELEEKVKVLTDKLNELEKD